VAQNIHVPVSENCSLTAQRKGARNFHRMMQKRWRRRYPVRVAIHR
jgi:hypothetical protein